MHEPRRIARVAPTAPLPHFNEVDEGVAVDALVTNRIWKAMGFDPATTLHDIRWGEDYGDEFVWVFLISGSVPASHNGGYEHSYSKRQPPMYFPLGGGTLSGCSKPGEIVWSRVVHRGRSPARRHRPWSRRRPAGRGDAAAARRHDAGVADHARRRCTASGGIN